MRKFFWRFGILFIAMMLLTSCSQQPEAASSGQTGDAAQVSFHLALDEYPVMDGSTANLPMMAEVMSEVCGISLEEAKDLTKCSKTSSAWQNITQGMADILLVYEADESTKAALEASGVALEITPIGRDALVFIENENNPVKNLTQQQLIAIYTGAITNWKEFGGNDQDIIAYQRKETSGSQSLFMKLLMKGKQPMEAPQELKPTDMDMLIDALASYDNAGNALGYSVFYYANYMYAQPGLQMIQVDGIAPSDETIADGSYPLLNEYYVVIRADEPADSPARQLRDWILSQEGKAALKKAGYIPI